MMCTSTIHHIICETQKSARSSPFVASSVVRACWSVCSVNLVPHRKVLHFSAAHTQANASFSTMGYWGSSVGVSERGANATVRSVLSGCICVSMAPRPQSKASEETMVVRMGSKTATAGLCQSSPMLLQST